MPRPQHQIPLDYQTQVLSPEILPLLHTLLCASKTVYCREFEELYRAYSGWHEVRVAVHGGMQRGVAMTQTGKGKELKPEWTWLYLNYVVVALGRLHYLCALRSELKVTAYLKNEWVEVDMDDLPSIRAIQAPEFCLSGFSEELQSAGWIWDKSPLFNLPADPTERPSIPFLISINLLSPPPQLPSPSHSPLSPTSHNPAPSAPAPPRSLDPSKARAVSSPTDKMPESSSASGAVCSLKENVLVAGEQPFTSSSALTASRRSQLLFDGQPLRKRIIGPR
ncbi:hypothetical protein JCM10207_003540 [Rhodosporidiobolus poonsookiae]